MAFTQSGGLRGLALGSGGRIAGDTKEFAVVGSIKIPAHSVGVVKNPTLESVLS